MTSKQQYCPMLDVASMHCPPSPSHSMMSVEPYLLASSPPGSSLEFHSYSFASGGFQHYPSLSSSSFPPPEQPTTTATESSPSSPRLRRGQGALKPIIIRSDSDGEQSSGNLSDGESSPNSPCSPGRARKQVTFADNYGRALAEVRIMSEPSDHPPNLNPEILATLTQGAQAKVTDKPPLKLTFSQPASDYLAFRDKIERNLVSLENVILKDYVVAGTIKVKNISFKKNVFVRFTSTSWESYEDVVATYVSRPGDIPGRPSCHDTFTFEFEVPPKSDVSKSVEFAVCFDTGAQQHWDSNGGANYGVVWEKFQDPAPLLPLVRGGTRTNNPFVFGPDSLSDFACWHHVDTSTPYY
ncbi:hypothetical protein ACOMHN_046998 [Nucella lapillus]